VSIMKLGERPRNFALRKAAELRAGKLIPSNAFLEITYRCNLRCIHCGLEPYLNQGTGDELTFSEIVRIFDQFFEAGVLGVSFSGGEPLCRPDLLDIMEHARKTGLFFGLKTNGTLITEEIARALKKMGITTVNVSLYGATPETHEHVTRVAGSFEKSIRGIEILKSNSIRVGIKTSIMKCNFHQDADISALAKQLGVPYNLDPVILPKFGQPGSADEIRINDEQLRQLILRKKWINLDFTRFGDDKHGHILCGGGRVRFSVSPYGDVFPCPLWHVHLGNLRRQSFNDIWNGEAAKMIRAITIDDFPDCVKCEYVKYCVRCPGMVQMENSRVSGPSPENCRLARAIKGVIDNEETLREPHDRVGAD
jgi:radical SAM protein with 4Fe4S-binding SPASM domain